jgi:hypothetical protein
LAATASLVLANVIGARSSHRFDLTATGEHVLSPRTRDLLASLPAPYEFVLAGSLKDATTANAATRESVDDVLDLLARGSKGRVRLTRIDTSSPQGTSEYAALIERLRQRDAAKIEQTRSAVDTSLVGGDELASSLDLLSRGLLELRDAMPSATPAAETNRKYVDLRVGDCANNAKGLRDLIARSRSSTMNPGDALAGGVEQAASSLRAPFNDLKAGLSDISTNLSALSGDQALPEMARSRARSLSGATTKMRDRAAVIADSLERLPRLDSSRVSRTLERGSAMLLIGPSDGPGSGLTAIPMDELFLSGNAAADARRNAEDLLTTALASLARPIKPIVVLVHGQSRGFFERRDNRPDWLASMQQRLGLRGIDIAIWEAAIDADPPSLTRLDPKGERPVVFIVVNTQSYAASAPGAESGADRVKRLAAAVNRIVSDGRPLLLNLFPSTLPTYGEKDPMVECLPLFGLVADTARVLLAERFEEGRRRVDSSLSVRAESDRSDSIAITKAIRGLPTKLEWAVAMKERATPPARVWPLLVERDGNVWNESQWLGFIQVPVDQRAGMPDQPRNDSSRDEGAGPWIVAAAAERALPAGGSQRLVAVSSNSWFFTPALDEASMIDGRIVPTNPGNPELLESSIYWLAGQDDMIAASPSARSVPLVQSITPATLAMVRGAIVIGMPALVLLVGVLWRWWKG